MNENEDLRELFADATSGIRPQGSLEDILDRTKKVDPMTRRWFLPVVAAAAVIGLAIGGAVLISKDSNSPKGVQGPSNTPSTNPTKGTTLPAKDIKIFYLGDTPSGPRLFSEKESIEAAEGDGTPNYTLTAVTRMQANKAVDPDLRSVWPASAAVGGIATRFNDSPDAISVYFVSGTAQERPAGMSAEEARLSIEQLVRTVQSAAASDAPVVFAVEQHHPDGTVSADDQHPLHQLLGVPIDGPVNPASDDTVLAPVQITDLTDGMTVPAGDLKVTGLAATFEANVVWELRVGGDAVVQHGHTTATECCTLAPYEFTIKNLEPGRYTVVVHDEDMSGSGRPVNQDTKDIVVQ
ncbi:MAG: Gmad2 immunoglobulin-like domain-containing protein [Marmoricola sp.]